MSRGSSTRQIPVNGVPQHTRSTSNEMMAIQRDEGGETDSYNIIKWHRARKALKILPAAELQLSNPNIESLCQKLTIQSIEGLNYSPKSQDTKRIALKFNFSLFSNTHKRFFGRSFQSIPYNLKQGSQGGYTFEVNGPFRLFFHSQLERHSQAKIVIEGYLLEIGNHEVVLHNIPCGVAEISVESVLPTQQTAPLKATSMRSYVSNYEASQKTNSTGIRLGFFLQECRAMEQIKHLIPESILVSSSEFIPGIFEKWEDNKFQGKDAASIERAESLMMQLQPTFKVYLTQVRIQFYDSVEKEILKQVQSFLETSKAISNKVIFKDKKLICGFHNGWEFVNRGGNNNFLILKSGPRSSKKNSEGVESNVYTLEYNGMHEIDNVFDAPGSVLVLQLIYDIEYVTQAKQIASRVVSWIPINLAGKLAVQKEVFCQEIMAHGPGKSVDGQRMISLPYKKEFDIEISANFNIVVPGANQMSIYEEIQRMKQNQADSQAGPNHIRNLQNETQQQPGGEGNRRRPDSFHQSPMKQQFQGNNQGYGGQPRAVHFRNQSIDSAQNIDPQVALVQLQIQNEKRRFEELQEQIFQRGNQASNWGGGAAYVNQLQEFQQITWEPRNEQERQLKALQMQSLALKDQIIRQQYEKDQLQLTLTNEYRQMREEMSKQRQGKSDNSFFKGKQNRFARTAPQGGYRRDEVDSEGDYDDNDEDIAAERIKGRTLDFSFHNSKVTYQGNKENPLVVHLNQPQFNKRELSKKDRIDLINLNIPGLLDDIPLMHTAEEDKELKNILNTDLNDPLKASIIAFRILSFKPAQFSGLPKRMYLTMNFFDFPKYQTESFSYESNDDRSSIKAQIEKQTPIVLIREAFLRGDEERYLVFKFEVDPSKSRYNDLFIDFLNYLHKKSLHVDIWDADTLMLFGSFKLPLNEIRRSGMNRKTAQMDLDIINTNYAGLRGSIQIHIDHIGKEEANPSKRKEKEEKQTKAAAEAEEQNKPSNNINERLNKTVQKSKVISEKSVSIPHNFIKNQKTIIPAHAGLSGAGVRQDEAARKLERIKRFKNSTLNQAALVFEGDEDQIMHNNPGLGLDINKIKELSQFRIDQIADLKNKKRPELVKSVITKFLNEEKIISLFYGKQQVIPFVMHNQTSTIQTYNIIIEDGDSDILDVNEFEPITDPVEWKYWNNAMSLPEPSSYDILQGHTLVLEPNEQVTVLFKCITYRLIDPSIKDRPDVERIAFQRESNYRKKYINPRSIDVFFCLKQQTVVGGFRLKVEPHQQVIDHLFRYYERELKAVKITLPPLYLKTSSPKLKPTLHVTNNLVQVEWINDSEISIFAKLPSISQILKFNILVYNTEFRSNLLSNIQIELHALDSTDLHVNMGQTTVFKLNLPGDIPRVVKLYSSNPEILWFSPPFDSNFTLPPGKLTQIESNTRSMSTASQRVQVNAVDSQSNELVHSWIVRLETEVPQPSKLIEMTATACLESIQVFDYFNKSKMIKNYQFLSSDPSILEILDPSKQIMGSSAEEIAVRIVDKEYTSPEASVIIFVSDYEETIFDTLKLRIRYIFNEEAQNLQAFHNLKNRKDQILQQQNLQAINHQAAQASNEQYDPYASSYQQSVQAQPYGQQSRQYAGDTLNNRQRDQYSNQNYQDQYEKYPRGGGGNQMQNDRFGNRGFKATY